MQDFLIQEKNNIFNNKPGQAKGNVITFFKDKLRSKCIFVCLSFLSGNGGT